MHIGIIPATTTTITTTVTPSMSMRIARHIISVPNHRTLLIRIRSCLQNITQS
jgi:hypothetical protein